MALAKICQMEQLMPTNSWLILLSFRALTKVSLKTSLKCHMPQCEIVSAADTNCVLFTNTRPTLGFSVPQVLPPFLLTALVSEFKQLFHSFHKPQPSVRFEKSSVPTTPSQIRSTSA